MSDFTGVDFGFPDYGLPTTLEKTPSMHGGAKEEQIQEVAPGWYANCYLCAKSFEEQYMVRKEYRRETKVGTGWYAKITVHRYVISFCVWCQHSHLGK